MIYSLNFDSDVHGDKELYEIYNHAEKMHSVLWEIDQLLRSAAKYQDNEEAEKIREELRGFMIEHGISHLF